MSETLEEFFSNPSRDWETIKAINNWDITLDDTIVTLKLSASDGERYIIRFVCDDYPKQPPSVFFINDRGEKNDMPSWPGGQGRFHEYVKPPPESFICASLTREGVQHHPPWKDIWDSNRYTLMDVFNFMQRLLRDPQFGYLGRHQ